MKNIIPLGSYFYTSLKAGPSEAVVQLHTHFFAPSLSNYQVLFKKWNYILNCTLRFQWFEWPQHVESISTAKNEIL